jgi:hypothetical protein
MPKDHADPESEYFHRQEQEKLAKLKATQEAEARTAEAAERRALHHLRCGKCGDKMNTELFKGIDIEVCPTCGAVLLDPGELEKLVGNDEGFVLTLKDFFKLSKRER